ncbi:DOCK family protein [Heterostelium album PN500]|uniref:DOCK family protein n=1 Tax=Heterostelium pallidum (strain ATCC 26659 / Pp 5 / PN500) TaxID=670386 RepID=D3BRF9_HETP5|nr:DOCK family protein [Heterostelium album PN500]EFA75991.1 DOCK family protein [Heterostelium album PN500]|eukprot:XP_020428125.1 DOCK family protein [Heterostelium album PN500]
MIKVVSNNTSGTESLKTGADLDQLVAIKVSKVGSSSIECNSNNSSINNNSNNFSAIGSIRQRADSMMEGSKKLSSFIKSRKSFSSSNSLIGLQNGGSGNGNSLSSSVSSGSGVGSSGSSNSNTGANSEKTAGGELTPEEYNKRNTRQIPEILLEDEPELEDEEYPFDFERYYYESKEINRETVRELVVIPEEMNVDTLEYVVKDNRIRSPPTDYKSGVNQVVDDCLDFYLSTNYKTLKTTSYQNNESPHAVVHQLMERKIESKPPPDETTTSTAAATTSAGNKEVNDDSNTTSNSNRNSTSMSTNIIVKTDEVDELHMGYLERQLRVQNKADLQNQKSLFSYFTLSDPPVFAAEPSPYAREKSRSILVECKELTFKLWDKEEESEPFYCSLYLYDIAKKARISEVFHFDFNNEKTEKLLGGVGNSSLTGSSNNANNKNSQATNNVVKDEINRAKRALFNVGKSSQDIYLVLKVEKILMGDIDDQAEPYIKLNLKDKEKDKLKDQIKSYCSRLGNYRQAFCWGCVPLFGMDGELGVGDNTHFRPLYKYRPDTTDAQMLDSTMSEYSKSASTKKLKVIPGYCTIDVKELSNYYRTTTTDPIPNTVIFNQSLLPLQFTPPPIPPSLTSTPATSVASTPADSLSPRPLDPQSAAATLSPPPVSLSSTSVVSSEKIVREIQEFAPYPRFEPNTEFVHNLYVYPESVNLSNRSGSVTARNITVKVQLMENDDNVNYEGMKLIYGRSNTDLFTTKYYSSVTYHSKTPIFYDEIKMRLPMTVLPTQHLLFTFYHITCQKSSDKESNYDQPIGHAVLPLFQHGRILSDDVYSLPVALELPPKYNKDETEAALRYIDNKKPIFQVRTKLFSSIISNDEHLNQFFNVVANPAASTDQLKRAIRGLSQAKIESLSQFFPILMNQLFRIMTGPLSNELSMVSFILMGELLAIVNDVAPLTSQRYSKYVFNNNKHSDIPVYEVLIRTWLELVRFQEHNSDNILRFSKFFFSIIYKSMALSLIERSRREENKTRKGRFVGARGQLRKLIAILRWEASTRVKHTFKLSKELIKSLSTLISSLLSIADRGYVFSIINRIVADFESSTNGESEAEMNELKFEFLRIICQNEYFVQLNIPLPYRIDPSLKLNTILTSSKHFISEILMANIANGLAHKEVLVRMDAANSLRDTLIRIEMDSRWQEPLTKQRIVGVFVPYLSSVVKESKDKYVAMFEILCCCVDIFEFVGKDKLLDRALESTSIRTSTAKSILEDFYTGNRTSPYSSKKQYSRSLREKRVDARKSILDSYNSPNNNTLTKDKRGFAKGTLGTTNKINIADYDDRLESNLAYEIGAIILDISDDFMYEFERELKTAPYYDVLEKTTREEAAAFTYILMRKNYEQTRKNFVRTKTQFIIGLSKIVSREIRDDYYLRKSLDTINTYAVTQAEKLGTKSFAKQVEDLTKRMHTFVIDNIKINNHKDDPEMVADLYHRIAENNKSNADTRLIWLQGLANFNRSQENYSEAAQCYLHMAALVAEYLALIGSPVPTISGSQAFTTFNRNSLEESNSYIEREDDESNQRFTIDYFQSLINDAIGLLKEADLFEMANLVYKLLLPVHEHNLNYEELANCHGDLQVIFKKIVECTRTKSRMLGSYYRVGLYGNRFEELNGIEFIYKEPKITRLVEIKDRLRTLFSKKFSVDEKSIQIIEGSTAVDLTKLDVNQCYLQLTSVVPYFSEEELTQRRTPFDHCINLNRFMFETPFTASGAGHGNSVADQYKQKTILTVQNYFPYTKKRIQVVSKQIINLSPIENSIESIEARTETLLSETKAAPPNLKMLQQVIQGSVRLQVNAGPQEICRIFLAEGSGYPPEFTARLRRSLSAFLGVCADALQLNRSLIDQSLPAAVDFQDEMESGYLLLLNVMEPFHVIPPEGSYFPASNSSTPTLSGSNGLGNSHEDIDSNSSNSPGGGNSLAASGHLMTVGSLQTNNPLNNSTSIPPGSYRKSFTQRLSNSFKKGSPMDGATPDSH